MAFEAHQQQISYLLGKKYIAFQEIRENMFGVKTTGKICWKI